MSNEMVTVDCRNLATSIADNGKPQFVFKLRGRAEHEVICGKSIVVFHCSACLLQDFCNLLHTSCICAKLPKLNSTKLLFWQFLLIILVTQCCQIYCSLIMLRFLSQTNTYMYTGVIKLNVYNKVYTLHAGYIIISQDILYKCCPPLIVCRAMKSNF